MLILLREGLFGCWEMWKSWKLSAGHRTSRKMMLPKVEKIAQANRRPLHEDYRMDRLKEIQIAMSTYFGN